MDTQQHDIHTATQEHHSTHHHMATDSMIKEQRAMLAQNTEGKGFGPQAPHDIDPKMGKNTIIFGIAPEYSKMNLCNIHFHKNAEHKDGEFTKYTGK